LGYDAATIGNHDFDGGIENLSTRIGEAKFPFVNCNYNFKKTILDKKILPYTIIEKNNVKVGVIGVGIELEGLVSKNLYDKIQYQNPLQIVNDTALFLKTKEHCHLVVCLSHLGYKYDNEKISDEVLAAQSAHVDLILGGHTHTFFEKPKEYTNKIGEKVIVNQVGWAGINLGRIDLLIQNKKKHHISKNNNIKIN
jgi:5'-nucleotidase